jgi:CDP-diacylglycerol--serine O-phosphatidyltransferase
VPYWSGKDINLRKSVPFIVVAAFAIFFALTAFYPPGVLFALFLIYAASGYVLLALRFSKRNKPPVVPE